RPHSQPVDRHVPWRGDPHTRAPRLLAPGTPRTSARVSPGHRSWHMSALPPTGQWFPREGSGVHAGVGAATRGNALEDAATAATTGARGSDVPGRSAVSNDHIDRLQLEATLERLEPAFEEIRDYAWDSPRLSTANQSQRPPSSKYVRQRWKRAARPM